MDDDSADDLQPVVAFDDADVMDMAAVMLRRHGMWLMRPVTHDPRTHEVRFYIQSNREPGVHICVELPIDLFEPELFAQSTWLRMLEREAVRRFGGPTTAAG